MVDTFELIAARRRQVADLVEPLTDEQWQAPSLCEGWTVHDVLAHLTMPFQVRFHQVAWRLAKAKGSWDRVTIDYVREQQDVPGRDLVATLRTNAEHRFTPPGLPPEAPLTDAVVHGLDITVPLGIDDPIDPESARRVLDFLVSGAATRGFLPKGRVPGLHYEATDVGWIAGAEPNVRGPATSLMLALCGRRVGLDGLEGDGVAELSRRLG